MNVSLSTALKSQQHLKKRALPTSAGDGTSAPQTRAARAPQGGEAELGLPQSRSHRSRDSPGLAHSRQCHLLSPGPRPVPPTGVPSQPPSSSMAARPQKAAAFLQHIPVCSSGPPSCPVAVWDTRSCWMSPCSSMTFNTSRGLTPPANIAPQGKKEKALGYDKKQLLSVLCLPPQLKTLGLWIFLEH